MRTTLGSNAAVFQAAKERARRDGRTAGQVISELARRSLKRHTASGERNGIPLLEQKPDAARVTLDLVNVLRDELR